MIQFSAEPAVGLPTAFGSVPNYQGTIVYMLNKGGVTMCVCVCMYKLRNPWFS